MRGWVLSSFLPPATAVAAVLAGGCAAFGVPTQNGYNQVLHTWIGQPPSDLLARWGQPYRRFLNTDGTVIFLYMREDNYITDLQSSQPQFDANNYIGAGAPAVELFEAAKREQEYQSVLSTHRCLTLFNIDRGGIIREVDWTGDECRAVPPRGAGPDAWSTSARQLVSPHALDTAGST